MGPAPARDTRQGATCSVPRMHVALLRSFMCLCRALHFQGFGSLLQDALQELALMGYIGSDSSHAGSNGRMHGKFNFTKGTGAGGQRGSKKNGSGRNGSSAARARGHAKSQ